MRDRTQFNFEHYEGEKDRRPHFGHISPELVFWLQEHKDSLIRQAKMDLAVVGDHVSVLANPWNGHARGSVIIARDWNFLRGEPFAISRETVYEQVP
jgi:hypothetical protein